MPKVEAKDHRRRLQEPKPTLASLRRQAGIEIVYHVFSDRRDDWLKSRKRANRLFRRWARTYGTARLYEERYTNRANDEMESEKCLRSYGTYPM